MAKKEEEPKITLERTYNVPLRKEWLKVPKYKRAKKAARALREFLAKHMKSDDVKIGKYANLDLWKHGIKNPPHHINVIAKKDDKGVVTCEIVTAPKEKPKKDEKVIKDLKKESKVAEKKIKEEISELEKKTASITKDKEENKEPKKESKPEEKKK